MHGPDVRFYKYLAPESALVVLENGTFKWSSPAVFNDPFDFPTDVDFCFSAEELAAAVLEETNRLVYGELEPVGDNNNTMFLMALAARRNPRKPPEAEARAYFQAHIHKLIMDDFPKNLAARRQAFAKFRREYSVFCLSTSWDNLLMWAHYCRDHQGCVFALRCIPELDNAIRGAVKVNYVNSYPVFASLPDFVQQSTGQKELDYDRLLHAFFYSKSVHWAYEDEWRCVCPLQDPARGYDLIRWAPEELEAVYIGCNASPVFRERVTALVRAKSPQTIIYQGRTDVQNYALVFD